MNDYQEIATAPGDLPQREIVRRLQTVRNQFRHENTTSPLAPGPGDPVRVDAIAGAGRGVVSAAVSYTTDGTNPNDSSQRVEMANVGTEWVCFGEYARRWTATLPGHDHGVTVRYRIVGRDAEGREVAAQDGQGLWYGHPAERSVTTFAYRVRRDHSAPDWFKTAVIYQIFVDRFRRPGGFVASEDLQSKHGGRINGITEQLPYLSELGVTCLWLSPIGPAPSYHRYDTTDYFAVDPVLGEVNDLRSLTDAAHERGMRVLLDFVPCHLSKDHPAFVAAQSDPNAETREWFVFYEWPTKYRSFLDMVPGL
ncbi:MAG: alpha-amylase family glycosyl hydrolase, partial [Spirochaetota bacterium]